MRLSMAATAFIWDMSSMWYCCALERARFLSSTRVSTFSAMTRAITDSTVKGQVPGPRSSCIRGPVLCSSTLTELEVPTPRVTGLVDPVEESGEPKGTPLLHQTKVHWSTFGQLVIILLLRLQLLVNLGGDYRAHHRRIMDGALQLVLAQGDQQLVGPVASISGRHAGVPHLKVPGNFLTGGVGYPRHRVEEDLNHGPPVAIRLQRERVQGAAWAVSLTGGWPFLSL